MILTADNIRASFDEYSTVQVVGQTSSWVILMFTTQRGGVLKVTLHRNVWEQLQSNFNKTGE